MKVEVKAWDVAYLQAVAEMTFDARKEYCQQTQLTVADIAEKFSGFLSNHPVRLVLVIVDEGDMIGFLILYLRDSTVLEMNPGQILGGYPVILSDYDQKAIGSLLLDRMLDFAKQENAQRIECVTSIEAKHKIYDCLYREKGFAIDVQYVEMLKHLPEKVNDPTLPEVDVMVKPLTESSIEALYQCYHAAFSNGDANFFFAQSKDERREYFDALGYVSAVKEKASFTLYDEERLIGFSYVLAYGEGNCHISCMCIDADYRRKGLGQYLLDQIIITAAQAGYKTMTLGTDIRMGAFSLYVKNGFEVMEGSTIWTWNNKK